MELRQLRYFLALIDSRHFGRAAQELSISQQALSYSIAQLEKSLGTRLFNRRGKSTALTEAGKFLERRARMICMQAKVAESEMAAVSTGVEGTIAFGVCSAVAYSLLANAIDGFSRTRPKITLKVAVDLSTRLYDRLISSELEFVVAAPQTDISIYTELDHETFVDGMTVDSNFLSMRLGHPLLKLEKPGLAEIVKYPWLMPSTFPEFKDRLFKLFSERNVAPPERIVLTDSYTGSYAIMLSSNFVALTGVEATERPIKAGLLGGFPLPELKFDRKRVVMSSWSQSEPRIATAALMGLFRSLIVK
jgi:DNA-binding transcriptional LysR family regulator